VRRQSAKLQKKKGQKMKLSSLIKNSGKIAKKTIRIATAISEDDHNNHLNEIRAKFSVNFKRICDSYK
jgi:hypothetical protein